MKVHSLYQHFFIWMHVHKFKGYIQSRSGRYSMLLISLGKCIGQQFGRIPRLHLIHNYKSLHSTIHPMPDIDLTRVQLGNPNPSLEKSITAAVNTIISYQNKEGYWHYGTEVCAYSTSCYVLCLNYIGETIQSVKRDKIVHYLKSIQLKDGGWALAPDGPFDYNVSILAYLALKILGEPENSEPLLKAQKKIVRHDGVCDFDVTFRLAFCGIIPWKNVFAAPIEIMLLPVWFPINIFRVGSWARTCFVPMLLFKDIRPSKLANRVSLGELHLKTQADVRSSKLGIFNGYAIFSANLLRFLKLFFPKTWRELSISKALKFIEERTNEFGFASYSTPTGYALMAFHAMGFSPNSSIVRKLRAGFETFVQTYKDVVYVVPFNTAVWDTCSTAFALNESGQPQAVSSVTKAPDWLRDRQILDLYGDWTHMRPNLKPGGWAFEFSNPFYPDMDDTAAVLRLLSQTNPYKYISNIERGFNWLVGMGIQNGGWGAFDADNRYQYFKKIPIVDQVSWVFDSPTVDITGRCLLTLGNVRPRTTVLNQVIDRATNFIIKRQEINGSWYGRWGVNYIHGTGSALQGLEAAGYDCQEEAIKRGVNWLLSVQNKDGGWGESIRSYEKGGYVGAASTVSQTSWALLGLMAGGCVEHAATREGIDYLIRMQRPDGVWDELSFTGVGAPGYMYIRYHGGHKYIPLYTIAKYRNLKEMKSSHNAPVCP